MLLRTVAEAIVDEANTTEVMATTPVFLLTNALKQEKSRPKTGRQRVTRSRLRSLTVAMLFASLLTPMMASAQTGEFLCSAGTRNGLACESFDDCPGGACVIAQGVCGDGFICDCPSGTCSTATVCADDTSFGTCVGGVSPGLCCDVALNCIDGDSCTGSARVCVGGADQGFSCTSDAHCRNGKCQSTGCFCDGGDFDGYTCVTTTDCPNGGTCDCSSVAATPTPPTVVPTTPARTPTPITPGTQKPTATKTAVTPKPTSTGSPAPTSTSPPLQDTPTPLPSNTPEIGMFVTVTDTAIAGSNKLKLSADPRRLPTEGVVEVGGHLVPFTRRVTSTILDVQAETGLPATVSAGSTVRLIEYTPTPGPSQNEYEASAEGCTMQRSSGGTMSVSALSMIPLLIAARALRRR